MLQSNLSQKSRHAGITIFLLLAVYIACFVFFNRLDFEIRKDERFYWPVVQHFAAEFPPSLATLKNYDVPSTPLAFIFFGGLEHFTGGGIRLARVANMALSFIIVLGIAWPRENRQSRPWLAAIGLLAFPYYLGLSAHFYPDILAAFFVWLGMVAYTRGRYAWSALALAMAIATRQYMVAFPAALLAHEFVQSLHRDTKSARNLWPYALASATLLAWFAFFGGFAPPAAQLAHLSSDTQGKLHIDHGLYLLSCIGAYYVISEALLFRGWQGKHLTARQTTFAISLIIAAFACWPPWGNPIADGVEPMGYLDKALHFVLPDAARIACLAALAIVAMFRFRGCGATEWLLFANAAALLRSHIAWDKYALPLIVALWYLQSTNLTRQGTRESVH